ncbi:PucR family transcriptional regulator [Microbispora rosea]|uniref:PucR family transcriptional regulator n=1 Tax=Microbispora rosea TaxID=58117 RepID=UPI0037C96E69
MDLQRVVDDLALRLERPLLLEDGRQRVVAYSEQDGPMDDVRRHSILRRHTTPDVRAFLRATGIHEATRPLRTPGAPELGLLPRVCVPVRHDGLPLGFLWFIDAAPAMTEPEIAVAAEVAPTLAMTLFHESMASELASRRELEAVTGLLLREPDADRTLIEAGAFPHNQPVTVAVARPVRGGADETLRLTLERGLLALRRLLARHHPLHLVRYDHAVLLTAGTRAFPEEMHAALGTPVLVGIGSPRPSLSLAAESYEEALHAAEVVANVPEFGPSAEWDRLGVYRMLSGVPHGNLHPGLARLLDEAQHRPLLETLEIYLDLAGNAQAVSRRLRLHRTSLYYRLRRVEELAETDLRDGEERLSLHLSLKLARLSGRYRPSPLPVEIETTGPC